MKPEEEPGAWDEANWISPLPHRNAMHYDGHLFERVDWTHGALHMRAKHGITSVIADEALGDPNRVVVDPDYNSTSGQSVRIIGFSTTLDEIITVIVVVADELAYGATGWLANAKDRRLYNDGPHDEEEGDAGGQED